MKKALTLVICVLASLILLSGCATPAPVATQASVATQAPAADKPVAVEPAKPADTAAAPAEKSAYQAPADKVKIAYIGPLTGTYVTYGTNQRQAIELAVEEVNKAGGINGKTIEIEWNDDKSDPNETVNLAAKVVEENDVLTVFGPFTTTSALASAQIFIDAKMPVCSGSVSNPDWAPMGNGWFFRGDATTRQMTSYFADFVYDKMGIKKVGMYYEQSDWGQGMYDEFKKAFEAKGGQIVIQDVFQVDQKDFNASLSKFKAADANYYLFVLNAHLNEGSLLVNQMRNLGITKEILSNNSLQDPTYIKNVGENSEGQIMLSYFGSHGNSDKFEAWKTAYEARWGKKVETHSFNCTDLIHVMFEAIKNSGGTSREGFVKAMHEIKDFPGLQTNITIEENGDMLKPFTPFMIKGGEFVPWTPSK
jgi:branched-chain amino acid transport system substrate-binding protein